MSRVTSQHQDLWTIVLDMFLSLGQVLNTFQSVDEYLRLGRAAPVSLGLPVEDVEVEDGRDEEGYEGGHPVHGEHGE